MTDPTPNRPPLWEVMVEAYANVYIVDGGLQKAKAAELRAMTDWLLPEEPPPMLSRCRRILTYEEMLSVERQRLRDILLAEVNRAEGRGRLPTHTRRN